MPAAPGGAYPILSTGEAFMLRLHGVIGAIGLTLAVAGAAFVATHRPVEVTLPRPELQRRVGEHIPLAGQRGTLSWRVDDAVVQPRPDGHISVQASVEANADGRTVAGNIAGVGRLSYRDGAVFVRGLSIERSALHIAPLDPQTSNQGGAAAPAPALDGPLGDQAGLAASHQGDGSVRYATATREAVADIVRQETTKGLAVSLNRNPVYRLPQGSTSQVAPSLAVRDVKATPQSVTFVLDPVSNTTRMMGYAAFATGLCVLLLFFRLRRGHAPIGRPAAA